MELPQIEHLGKSRRPLRALGLAWRFIDGLKLQFLTSFNAARGWSRRTIIRPVRSPQGELSFVKSNLSEV